MTTRQLLRRVVDVRERCIPYEQMCERYGVTLYLRRLSESGFRYSVEPSELCTALTIAKALGVMSEALE
jgi:hypothetical protein